MPLQVALLRQAVVSSRHGTVASYLSMQMQGVGVPANKTSPYSSRHSLGYVADIWSQLLLPPFNTFSSYVLYTIQLTQQKYHIALIKSPTG